MNCRSDHPSPVLALAHRRGIDPAIVEQLATLDDRFRYRRGADALLEHAERLLTRWRMLDASRVEPGDAAHAAFDRLERLVEATRPVLAERSVRRFPPIKQSKPYRDAYDARRRLHQWWRENSARHQHPPGYRENGRFVVAGALPVSNDLNLLIAAVEARSQSDDPGLLDPTRLLATARDALAALRAEVAQRAADLEPQYLGELGRMLVCLLENAVRDASRRARAAFEFEANVVDAYRPLPPKRRNKGRAAAGDG